MKIVNIDAEVFEKMLSDFGDFASRMEALCRLRGEKDLDKSMDNQDVCILLNISKRTLQTLRDNGTLPFSRISRKIYYKTEDVKAVVSTVEDRRKEALQKGKKI